MSPSPFLPRPLRASRMLGLLAAGSVAVVVLAIIGVVLARRFSPNPAPAAQAPSSFSSPYRNTHAEVRYVGDQACASCHGQIADSYHRHPMARDLSLVADLSDQEDLGTEAHNPFTKFGFELRVRRRGAEETHEVTARDAQGREVLRHEGAVVFAIGSGTRGRSYVINRDGYLFQSPLSWFAQAQTWDLSPGFSRSLLAGLPVEARCLFCHCNHAEPVPDTVNRYERPLQNASAIGCERCHGPGELHVARRERGDDPDGPDDTIVNPARLPPALREAVCQQCHLTTRYRLVRRGREPFAFRPGLPLQEYWSAFVKPARLADDYQSASRVEQMASSRCFQASQGALGCISCHDPHSRPSPAESVAFYRGRCLHCHEQKGCGVAPALRKEKSREDSCIVCHMPRSGSRKAVHVSDTDHRIRRRPARPAPPEEKVLQPGEPLLVPFHRGLPGPSEEEVVRDLGVALVQVADDTPSLREHASLLALPLLEAAVHRWPDDAIAWQAKGKGLGYLGHRHAALADLESALAIAPRNEAALRDAAVLAGDLGNGEAASRYWRRALAVDPWSVSGHAQLADLLARGGDWPGALAACRDALRVDPTHLDARALLVACLIRTSNKEQARAEFATLMALKPPKQAELQQWFAEQMR
jgi:Flp pilus assembly protein TadD